MRNINIRAWLLQPAVSRDPQELHLNLSQAANGSTPAASTSATQPSYPRHDMLHDPFRPGRFGQLKQRMLSALKWWRFDQASLDHTSVEFCCSRARQGCKKACPESEVAQDPITRSPSRLSRKVTGDVATERKTPTPPSTPNMCNHPRPVHACPNVQATRQMIGRLHAETTWKTSLCVFSFVTAGLYRDLLARPEAHLGHERRALLLFLRG